MHSQVFAQQQSSPSPLEHQPVQVKMGLIDFLKEIIRPGNGVDYPKPGDSVTVHYHGYLYDPTRSWNRGYR